ncbi:non-ribosomal peptide synthetase [Streptomyces sp. NPDC002454]
MTAQQRSVVDEIGSVIRKHPGSPAIETVDGVLSYQEFGEQVDVFVARLESSTVLAEFIGIEATRTSHAIVAMVGALRAGRPFVFLDPRDSAASNRAKVSSLGVNVIAQAVSRSGPPRLVPTPAEWSDGTEGRPARAPGVLAPYRGSVGYAIHTSGSTGQPKCVLVRALPLARVIADHVRVLELGPTSRTLQFARLTFDGCITEILWTLTSGACLVVVGEDRLAPGGVLRGTLEKFRVTHLKTTPFALTATEPTSAMNLAHVVNGGGSCRQAVVRKWSSAAAFHNAYGTTETTVCNFLSDPLDPEDCADSVPLGRVVGDCAFDVVPLPDGDEGDPLGPEGTRGELVITGESVAIGYLTGQDLHRFVDGDANRVYRTGDIVDHRDGRVYFVERLDRQLKVRGYRLDPGEIESAACRLPGVVEAVVTAESHGSSTDSGDDALVCYYQGTVTSREVRGHLEAVLDPYKVPSILHRVTALPYTRNGKVDRDALRASRRATPAPTASATPEEHVIGLVRQLTGVDDATLEDNFFAIGGDSASTVALVSKLRELGWMDAGVPDVLRAPTVKALVGQLRDRSV